MYRYHYVAPITFLLVNTSGWYYSVEQRGADEMEAEGDDYVADSRIVLMRIHARLLCRKYQIAMIGGSQAIGG